MSAHRRRPAGRHARRHRSPFRGPTTRVAALGLAALIVIAGGGTAAARLTDYMFDEDTSNPTAARGCVVRFDTLTPSGASVAPRIHANESHTCVGVSSVSLDWSNGDLIINNTGGSNNVVSVFAEEDETLAQRDIQCGPSGGGTTTRIRCYRDGVKIPAYSLEMYGPNVNLWVGWTMWMDQ
jgi:hypothetical protein